MLTSLLETGTVLIVTRHLDSLVFDADNHLYETKEAFTRHLPDEYKSAIDYVEVRGRTKIVRPGQDQRLHPEPDVRRRGSSRRAGGVLPHRQPRGQVLPRDHRRADAVPSRPSASRRPRIELMDELGVDRALMFPTLASLLEERMRDDPELIHAVIHSLNEWLYEQWTFNYEDRIFATPVITLPIVEKAIEELEWVRRAGRQDGADPPGSGAAATAARGRSASRSSIRSGRPWSTPTSSCRCTPPTAATRATRATGPARRRCCRSGPTPFRMMTDRQAARSRTR